MKLQILIPQYKETEDVIKPLLDSIELQQSVDLKNDVGVIIVNDGTDVHLSREFLDKYTYRIDYYLHEHKGVSATRNACLDYAMADYVMFCDADDAFYNICGLYIIFREINNGGFDSLSSAFIEEVKNRTTGETAYVNHKTDSTFVHGKVHRRQFLIDRNIRWNEKLIVHEDSYFNVLCQRLAMSVKYCNSSFYLWRWRADSVCRSELQWTLKTYEHLIESNAALVNELLRRGHKSDAQFYIATMLYNAYDMMNRPAWINQEDTEHRILTELRLKDYYLTFKNLYDIVDEDVKTKIAANITNKMSRAISFEDWLHQIENYK